MPHHAVPVYSLTLCTLSEPAAVLAAVQLRQLCACCSLCVTCMPHTVYASYAGMGGHTCSCCQLVIDQGQLLRFCASCLAAQLARPVCSSPQAPTLPLSSPSTDSTTRAPPTLKSALKKPGGPGSSPLRGDLSLVASSVTSSVASGEAECVVGNVRASRATFGGAAPAAGGGGAGEQDNLGLCRCVHGCSAWGSFRTEHATHAVVRTCGMHPSTSARMNMRSTNM